MNLWFSADHHYFHNNIIQHRSFSNINEMHSCLIEEHNKFVKPNDICYFVGDFAFLRKHKIQKIEKILNAMNGYKELILGNHDEGKPFTYVNLGFRQVHTSLILPDNNNYILCHDPANSLIDRLKTWIVGHVHDLFVTKKNCINVGVDVWNWQPVNFDTLKLYL